MKKKTEPDAVDITTVDAYPRSDERHAAVERLIEVCDQLRAEGRSDDEVTSMVLELVWFVIGGCDHKCLHMHSRNGNMYAEVYRDDDGDLQHKCESCGEEVQA